MWLLPFVEPLFHIYPSVTFTSVSVCHTLTLPPVQWSILPMSFSANWITLADLSLRDNYQCVSPLYPNLNYSSLTQLFLLVESLLQIYPSVTITSVSACFTLTLAPVHCLNLPLPFPADWAPVFPSRVATSLSPRPATSRMMAVSSLSPLSPGVNTSLTLA